VEGMQMRTAEARGKMIEPMVKAIVTLVSEGRYNPQELKKLAVPVRFGSIVVVIFRLLSRFGLVNSLWDKQLKENNAFERSFDQPYN
jgi:hypothetical protein